MKIAYMLGSLNRGGAEMIMLDIFRNAKKAELELICIHRKKGDLYQDFLDTEWPVYQIRPKFRFEILYLFRLRRRIKSDNISVIHAQHPVDGIYALLASMFTSIRVIITIHGFSLKKPRWYRVLLWFLFKQVDQILFVSRTQMDHYRNIYSFPETKYKITYNSVDGEKFTRPISSDIRQELGLSDNQLLLGSVGNFNSTRDQMTICRALELLKEANINFKFIFIGARQPHYSYLYDQCVKFCGENALDQHVLFLGAREDVSSLLQQMDAFVYSSKHDTFGIAVIEALISGIPVIVNDWKVMLEVTENGENAQIYKSENPQDLLLKLMMFLNDPLTYKQKADKQRTSICKKYDIESYLFNLKTIYSNL